MRERNGIGEQQANSRSGSVPMRRVLSAAGAFILASCSAMDYSAPISTFAQATNAADVALKGLNKTATDEYTAFLSQKVRSDASLVLKAGAGQCGLDSKRCRLVIENARRPGETVLFPPDSLLGNMVVVMEEIRVYAQNLAALAADTSAEDAQVHVNATLGSIETLANTVAGMDKKEARTVPSFATPVGSGVNWVIGQYANQVKAEGLKAATREADPVIGRAAALFESAAFFESDVMRVGLIRELQAKVDAYQEDRANATKLNEAVDAAKTYDSLLVAQPGDTFRKMGDAHAALTRALQNPDASWPEAISKIQGFAAQAEQLAKIVEDLAALTGRK